MNTNTRGLGKGKVRKVLGARINVRTKTLKPAGVMPQRVAVTTVPVENVKEHLLSLIELGTSEKVAELYDIITGPALLKSITFTSNWDGESGLGERFTTGLCVGDTRVRGQV